MVLGASSFPPWASIAPSIKQGIYIKLCLYLPKTVQLEFNNQEGAPSHGSPGVHHSYPLLPSKVWARGSLLTILFPFCLPCLYQSPSWQEEL